MNVGMGELVVILVICAVPTLVIAGGLAFYAVIAARERGRRAACPLCRSGIDRESIVCRACGRDLPAGWASPAR